MGQVLPLLPRAFRVVRLRFVLNIRLNIIPATSRRRRQLSPEPRDISIVLNGVKTQKMNTHPEILKIDIRNSIHISPAQS
jgi:hypothetical protein